MRRNQFQMTNPPTRNSGFTMIELIMVILVIAILVAILLPALSGVRQTARNAQVTVDIKNIEAAIANFKLKYGMEPPSSFLLSPNAADYFPSQMSPPPTAQLARNSVAIMRMLWPEYHLNSSTLTGLTPGGAVGLTEAKVLCGAECLVFFLGGVGVIDPAFTTGSDISQANVSANGFSANPEDPFSKTDQRRVGPFLEIDQSRLSDVNGNGIFELLDTLPGQTNPYQYFSSYDGRGYQIDGYDGTPSTADDEVLQLDKNTLASVYLKKDGKWPNPSGSPSIAVGTKPKATTSVDAWAGKSFQIISPGPDGEYGIGGLYSSQDGLGIYAAGGDNFRSQETRRPEADNITNFSGGPLGLKFFRK